MISWNYDPEEAVFNEHGEPHKILGRMKDIDENTLYYYVRQFTPKEQPDYNIHVRKDKVESEWASKSERDSQSTPPAEATDKPPESVTLDAEDVEELDADGGD